MSRLRSTKRRTWAIACAMTAVAMVALMVVLNTPWATERPVDPNWPAPRTVYFSETGHTLDRLFLDLWRNRGGTTSFGKPITAEITLDNGHVVQYLEYARFEFWPEGDETGNVVVLGNIGAELRPPAGGPDQSACQDAREASEATPAWLPIDPEDVGPNTAVRRYVAETGHSITSVFKEFWEATGEATYLGNPLSEEYVITGTTYQVFERGQLARQPESDPWLMPVGEILADCYGLDRSPEPQRDLPLYDESLFVRKSLPAGPSPQPPPGYERSIVVSLSKQTLWAYEGDTVVRSTLVSTGKERFETPPGLFFINTKVPVQNMEGLLLDEYYFEPHVPDVMYFTDEGHAIHGVYWHNNFGSPMSHGCINVPLGTSLWLYQWADIGTPVLIVN